ncbi:MAG: hypothetical protein R2736_02625 [Solirubrobacterales bacterium]
MAPSPRADGPGPTALIVVRNGVTHDARALREAEAAREAGLRPLVVGVVTARDRPRSHHLAWRRGPGIDPAGGQARALRQTLRRGRRGRGRGSAPAAPPVSPAAPPVSPAAPPVSPAGAPAAPPAAPGRSTPASAPTARRSSLRRTLVSAAFTRRAIGVVLRTRPALVHCNDFNTMRVGVAARLLTSARVIYDSHELRADRNGRPEWRPPDRRRGAVRARRRPSAHDQPGLAEVTARRYRVPHPQVVRNIPMTTSTSAPENPPVAVYVGGYRAGPRPEEAIAALRRSPSCGPRLIGLGRADYRAELVELAERHGVTARLELRDPVASIAVGRHARRRAGPGAHPAGMPQLRAHPAQQAFEYAAAGLLMVVSDLPVMAALVREWGVWWSWWRPGTESISAGLRALLDPQRRRRAADGSSRLSRSVTWAAERETRPGLPRLAARRAAPG